MQDYWVGQRVRLRAVEPDDAPAHRQFNRSADYGLLDQIYPPQATGRVDEWAERAGKKGFDDETYSFQIVAVESDELVGHIATHHADHRVGVFSYGLNVLEAFRGRGYAQEAICLVLRYYFQELRYQKANVEVMAGNEPSTRLHESMGFVTEGRRRRSAYTCGQLTDMLLFGMTLEEFRDRYPQYWRSLGQPSR